jgi:sugar lactone lactonase YvrE
VLASTLALFAVLSALPPFPPGTVTFSNTRAVTAVAAPDGGVWVGTSDGKVARYTEAGAQSSHALCCGAVTNLAMAPDGTVWFSNWGLGRIDGAGTVLQQYPATSVTDIAVASDGALWYTAGPAGVGRIAGGTATLLSQPAFPWVIAPASGGDVWVYAFGSQNDLFRVSPAGSVAVTPTPYKLSGSGGLQTLPDGTLFAASITPLGVIRRTTGGVFTLFPDFPPFDFVADERGNLWGGGGAALVYLDGSTLTRVIGELPAPTWCGHTLGYAPMAIDSTGGVWLGRLPPPPPPPDQQLCMDPIPNAPDLVRIDPEQFLAASHTPEHVPLLSPMMLVLLAVGVSLAGLWMARR